MLLANRGRHAQAVCILRDLVDKDPHNLDLNAWLSLVYDLAGNDGLAKK